MPDDIDQMTDAELIAALEGLGDFEVSDDLKFAHYGAARREYCYFLRVMHKLTYREIGARLGISGSRAQQIVFKEGRMQCKKWCAAGYEYEVARRITDDQIGYTFREREV